jgi:hypothetical protein
VGQKLQAVLVEEPPVWEFRGGHFFVTCEQSGVCRAYPPNVFFRTFADMAEAARQYKFTSAEVIQFPDQATR